MINNISRDSRVVWRAFSLILFSILISACGFEALKGEDQDRSVVEDQVQLGHPGIPEPGLEADSTDVGILAKPAPRATISSLQLINSSTGAVIRDLSNGAVINLSIDGTSLSIQALASSNTQSVMFLLDQQQLVDNVAPYTLGAALNVGSHTLTATAYDADYASGRRGSNIQISFSVVQSTVQPPPPEPPADPTAIAAFQQRVVDKAQEEANLALCADAATTRYVAAAGSAWCSEFARWVYIQAGVMTDSTSALWDILAWNQFQTFFTNRGKFKTRSQIAPVSSDQFALVGNYLLLDTDLDGVPNHSALIVGVSADLTQLYTVEGNVSNCTRRLTRNFWVNGVLDAKISGIGTIWP